MHPSASKSGFRTLTIIILVFIALFLLIGGIWLAAIGGSLYYVIAGVLLLVVAVQLYKRATGALWIYTALMLGSIIWAIWEVGTDFWALAPRLDILGILGLWLLIPAVTRGIDNLTSSKVALSSSLLIAIVVMVYSIFNDPQEINGIIQTPQPTQAKAMEGIAPEDWPAYGRSQGGERYSPLGQINDKNVKDLKEAWTFRTGDFRTESDSGETTNQVTPIKIGNNMFMCTPHQHLIALDPATGKEKWRFDPKLKTDKTFQHLTCRGVMYYDANNTTEFATSLQAKKSTSTECPRKVFVPVNDGSLIAVDRKSVV